MAQAVEILAQSFLENAQLLLVYDDATLIGSAFQVSVGGEATHSCTVSVTLADGTQIQQVVRPRQFNQIFNIPPGKRPHATLVTNVYQGFEWQSLSWGFRTIGISFG